MHVQVNTDNHIVGSAELTRQVEDVVERALSRFGDRITRVGVHLSDQNSRQKFGDKDKRCVMEARLAGLQPITASHQGSTLEEALDGAADTLEKTLKRTLGRRDSIAKRRAGAQAEFTAVEPQLQRDAAIGDQEDFLTLLHPLLGHLRDHARRELRILELSELLPPDQMTADEVLNEMTARAWLQFADRPREISLDLWLVNLLDEMLDEMVEPKRRTKKSLERRAVEVRPGGVPQVDDQEWWVWMLGDDEALLGEDETITLGDSISGGEGASAAEQLAARELKDRLHALLGALPKAQRQAFVLNVLEAYDLFEIAMLQDRPETEVQADIDDVRDMFREQLSVGDRSHTVSSPAAVATGSTGDSTEKT